MDFPDGQSDTWSLQRLAPARVGCPSWLRVRRWLRLSDSFGVANYAIEKSASTKNVVGVRTEVRTTKH